MMFPHSGNLNICVAISIHQCLPQPQGKKCNNLLHFFPCFHGFKFVTLCLSSEKFANVVNAFGREGGLFSYNNIIKRHGNKNLLLKGGRKLFYF